jgi:hypothetical protein
MKKLIRVKAFSNGKGCSGQVQSYINESMRIDGDSYSRLLHHFDCAGRPCKDRSFYLRTVWLEYCHHQ